MSDNEEAIVKVTGCNIGISFLGEDLEPSVVLSFYPLEGAEFIHVAVRADDMENLLPGFNGAMIRARVISEMVTIYPEQRDEILRNLMFRWTGTIVEENGDGS